MAISDESSETFVALLAKNEPIIRASIRAVIRRPEDVDEVIQSVCIIAWRKFDAMTDIDGFAKWACVIARYEILKFQRKKARDRFQLDEHLVDKIAAEGAEEISIRSQRIEHLEGCLQRLPKERRELVLKAYEPGCSIKQLAVESGKSADGLYQLMRRIRLELRRCVESQFGEQGRAV